MQQLASILMEEWRDDTNERVEQVFRGLETLLRDGAECAFLDQLLQKRASPNEVKILLDRDPQSPQTLRLLFPNAQTKEQLLAVWTQLQASPLKAGQPPTPMPAPQRIQALRKALITTHIAYMREILAKKKARSQAMRTQVMPLIQRMAPKEDPLHAG